MSQNTADKFIAALTEYFKCEDLGHIPGKCSRSKFEQYHTPLMSAIAYTLMGFIPQSKVSSSNKMSSINQHKCVTTTI